MPPGSGSTWIVVDDSNNRQPRRQVSENNLRAPRPLDFVSVSPQELQQQQGLLKHYKNKQRLERIRERPYPAESSQQPAITPLGFRRRLGSLPRVVETPNSQSRTITTSPTWIAANDSNNHKLRRHKHPYAAEPSQQPAITHAGSTPRLESLPYVVKMTSSYSRTITTSSTWIVAGDPDNSKPHRHERPDPAELSQQLSITPLEFRRRIESSSHVVETTSIQARMATSSTGATVGAYTPRKAGPRLLRRPHPRAAAIGSLGPPMPVSQLAHYHLTPDGVQVFPAPPFKPLPSGWDSAIHMHARIRPGDYRLRPLRLLSLDGGGVRGISSLRILKAIMDRIQPGARPCDYFDLIAGTSTGGLIAIMLGRLRMSVDECIQYYHRLSKKIFKRNPVAQLGSLAVVEHRFSPDNLEEAIKALVATKTPHNTKMADSHPRCARTFVVAVMKHNVNNQAARRFRSYATKSSPADTCEIWEAGRATSAAPSYFPAIQIPDDHGRLRSYIDGGLGYNNPCKELLNEAREVFGPEHPIGCFVSIGTGRDRNIAFNDVRKLDSAYKAFKSIALSSQQAHREIEEYFSRMPGVYYRFNAGQRLIGTSGDEDFVRAVALEDWHKMHEIETMTNQYLAEPETINQVRRCAAELAPQPARITHMRGSPD